MVKIEPHRKIIECAIISPYIKDEKPISLLIAAVPRALDPLSNPLARELSYIFQVKKVPVKTPILFINSDNKRFLLARIAPRGSERPFEAAIFTEDDDLLNLIHLLLVNSNKALLMQAFPT